MNTTQHTYALARAAHETALAALHAEVPALRRGATDAEFEAHDALESAARARLDVDALAALRREAEVAMVRAGLDGARRAFSAKASQLDGLTVETAQRHPRVWAQLIDLCFRAPAM